MITEEDVRRIALFFLFALSDEKSALQAAQKTVAQLKAKSAGSNADLIRTLRKAFEHQQKLGLRAPNVPLSESVCQLPPDVELRAWLKFKKDASEQEIVALVLAKILGFSEDDIARGLDVSIGTVHYRVGKGTRQLGTAMKARGV